MTVYFHVPASNSKPVREITEQHYNELSNRKGCLVGKIEGPFLSFWQQSYEEKNHSSVYLTTEQAKQIVALMVKENAEA